MTPFFSVITPTLMRHSLIRCCRSIDTQTFANFQHIVQVDCAEYDMAIITAIEDDERRVIYKCPTPHKNFGNTCRHNAWNHATGRFCLYVDDDNFLNGPRALEELSAVLEDVEYWAIVPIIRHGQRFFYDPPGNCFVDSANMVIRREYAQWPDGPEYTMDGLFCEQLKANYPYTAFPDLQPLIIMETSNEGR